MTPHIHHCPVCNEGEVCHWGDCLLSPAKGIMVGNERRCRACISEGVDEIDALPNPPRSELGVATLVRVVSRAARAALETPAEDAIERLRQHIDPLLPLDPTRTDPATWTRLGAHAGALDGWLADISVGPVMRVPRDNPGGVAGRCYAIAWNAASSEVFIVRMMEVASRGNV